MMYSKNLSSTFQIAKTQILNWFNIYIYIYLKFIFSNLSVPNDKNLEIAGLTYCPYIRILFLFWNFLKGKNIDFSYMNLSRKVTYTFQLFWWSITYLNLFKVELVPPFEDDMAEKVSSLSLRCVKRRKKC